MANVFDYLAWRGDLTFSDVPFNPVDNIILTHLSYLPLDGIVPEPGEDKSVTAGAAAWAFAQAYKKNPRRFDPLFTSRDDPEFLKVLGSQPRYRDLGLTAYINQIDPDEEKQFAAVTILLGGKGAFVAFRGTDNTLVGWKEDFNMSFNEEVPAQGEAVCYLEKIAPMVRGPLMIGGHSKGGNLAVYAASFCPKKIRKRITAVYCNDAPGFNSRVLNSEGYRAVRDRINSFVPEASIVGMLFENDAHYTVVKSVKSGFLQHDVYTWEVVRDDVVRLGELSKESRFFKRTINEWLDGLDNKQREAFIEAFYAILGSTKVSSIPELSADWLKNALRIIQSFTSIDDRSRDMILVTLGGLLKAARNNIYTLLPPAKKKTRTRKDAVRIQAPPKLSGDSSS
jgi:hypothetical protein